MFNLQTFTAVFEMYSHRQFNSRCKLRLTFPQSNHDLIVIDLRLHTKTIHYETL